ncbi:hypothetical protein D3C74_393720 [compost metagenome]
MGHVIIHIGQVNGHAGQVLGAAPGFNQGGQHVGECLLELFHDAAGHDLHILVQSGLPAEVDRIPRLDSVGIARGLRHGCRVDCLVAVQLGLSHFLLLVPGA